jgi:MFS family permease
MAAPQRATFEQWRILALMVVCVLINYLDRGNLSVSAAHLTRELHLNTAQMGRLLSAFFWTYTVCLWMTGWLLARFDVYQVLGAGFFLMSLATALTGRVETYWQLFALRLIVGAGASVAYPAFSKIIAAGFAEGQRGKANAFIDAGSKIAPALILILGGLIIPRWDWRALFLLLGVASMAWLPLWFGWRPRAPVAATKAAITARQPGTLELLGKRTVWGTFIGLYCLNSAWYFLITWFPYYLEHERHFSTQRLASLGSIPFWLLAVSASLSGWIADALITRGANPTVVRKTFLVTGMLMCTLLLPAGAAQDDHISIGLFTLACFAFGMTTSNHWGVTQTIAGPAAAGKWTGMQNAFGNLAGIAMPWITGEIVQRTGTFRLAFVLVAVIVTVGAASYAFLVGRLEPIRWREP